MRIRQRTVAFLQEHPNGIDDSELSKILGLSTRQQANLLCRELEKQGFVIRRLINGRIHSFWAGRIVSSLKPVLRKTPNLQDALPNTNYWFWEGNVQSSAVRYLVMRGYRIRSVADTASRQRGIDIVAEKSGRPLWITVKGYPRPTDRTDPSIQAAHWFKQAIFDVVQYREKAKDALLAVALPDYARYRTLAQRIAWLKAKADFTYYWINKSDEVSVE